MCEIHAGTCGGQNGTGAGFLGLLQFPLPVLISPTAPYSYTSLSPSASLNSKRKENTSVYVLNLREKLFCRKNKEIISALISGCGSSK
jgi:hypothetical protein